MSGNSIEKPVELNGFLLTSKLDGINIDVIDTKESGIVE